MNVCVEINFQIKIQSETYITWKCSKILQKQRKVQKLKVSTFNGSRGLATFLHSALTWRKNTGVNNKTNDG